MPEADNSAILAELFQAARRGADQRYALAPRLPKSVPESCRVLWQQAAGAFIFGLYPAALTMCGVFVESFLNRALRDETRKRAFPLPAGRPAETFRARIDFAVQIGLVSAEDGQLLQQFRDLVRNRYAHGDVQAIADALVSIEKITQVLAQAETLEVRELSPQALDEIREETLVARMQAADRAFAIRVIPWVGYWARALAPRVWGDPTTK